MIINILIFLALGSLVQWLFPWWSVAVVAFTVGGWRCSSGRQAVLTGFFGVALLWGVAATFVHFMNDGILSARVALLLHLPAGILLVAVTAVLGGVVGAVACLTGFYLQGLFEKS